MSRLTSEQRAVHERLVAKRPCKTCQHYNPLSSYSCSSECDYNHGGYLPVREPSEDVSKRKYMILKKRKMKK